MLLMNSFEGAGVLMVQFIAQRALDCYKNVGS